MKRISAVLMILLAAVAVAIAQASPVGVWKTIDDESGEAKSHVEIYQQGNELYGKIVRLLQKPADTLCEKCKGDRKDQPVLGMVIIEEMTSFEDYWKGGRILDPESGNDYRCSIWFEPGAQNELKVRGKHWTGLFRTQTWYRVTENTHPN